MGAGEQVREANLSLFARFETLSAAIRPGFSVPTTMSDVASTAIEPFIEIAIEPAAKEGMKLAMDWNCASCGASA